MTAFEDRTNQEVNSAFAELSTPARITLSTDVATRLLDLLSSDDAYRARFESNPRAALLEIGHETPAAHLGVFGLDPAINFCHLEGGLASREKLAAARELLLDRKSTSIFYPFQVCAN